jgi:hypothetical protein
MSLAKLSFRLTCILFIFTSYGLAQGSRDEAIKIINRAAAVAGIDVNLPFPSFTASGSITYNWGDVPVPGSAAISSSGNSQFRLDSTLKEGSQSFIVSTDAAVLKPIAGSKVRVPPRNVGLTKNPLIPVMELAVWLSDATATVNYLDTVRLGPVLVDRIIVQKNEDVDSDRSSASKIYCVDRDSAVVLEVDELLSVEDGGTSKITRQLSYSQFQHFSGVLLPTQIRELIAGQQTWSLQLSGYDLGVYVPPSLFDF